MISFKEFFILQEASSLFSVPRKLMGVSTNMNDIPKSEPYGFWVDKSGNFIPVESHLESAKNMIKAANAWFPTQKNLGTGLPMEPIAFDPKSYKDPYKVLYRNGWMRVISSDPFSVWYEIIPGGKISPKQIEFLNHIKGLYGKRKIEQDAYLSPSDFEEKKPAHIKPPTGDDLKDLTV